jgi:hypothetical protein
VLQLDGRSLSSDVKYTVRVCSSATRLVYRYHLASDSRILTQTFTLLPPARHSIGEDKKFFIEQWHQKLHNNTTPDDVVICEAYIAYLKADCNLDAYWAAIHAGGLSKEALAAYDRPIVTEPIPRMHIRDSLIKDFNEYLSVLKVHTLTPSVSPHCPQAGLRSSSAGEGERCCDPAFLPQTLGAVNDD